MSTSTVATWQIKSKHDRRASIVKIVPHESWQASWQWLANWVNEKSLHETMPMAMGHLSIRITHAVDNDVSVENVNVKLAWCNLCILSATSYRVTTKLTVKPIPLATGRYHIVTKPAAIAKRRTTVAYSRQRMQRSRDCGIYFMTSLAYQRK